MEMIVRPIGKGMFEASVGGRVLVTSKQPFLDGARVLAAEGVPGETVLEMRHAGSDTLALRATIAAAVRHTVWERKNGCAPRFGAWRSIYGAVGSPAHEIEAA